MFVNVLTVNVAYPDQGNRLRDLLRAVLDDTQRRETDILRETAVSFARSAYERTPKSKPLADVKVKNLPARIRRRTGVWVWTWIKEQSGAYSRLPVPLTTAIEHGLTRSGGKRPRFHKAEYRGSKQVIRNRGFARAGWIGVLDKLNATDTADEETPDAETAKTVFARATEQYDRGQVEIAQHVPPAIYQDQQRNVMGRALAATNEALQRQLNTHAQRIKQRWEK